ncbi:MAG: hypothetical protein AAGJ67_18495 [Pseudomonadota bacterium]
MFGQNPSDRERRCFGETNNGACDVMSYEALFTAQRVNHLYHQMNLGA